MKRILLILSIIALAGCSQVKSTNESWKNEIIESLDKSSYYEVYSVEFKETNKKDTYTVVIYSYHGGSKEIVCKFVKVKDGKVEKIY